MSSDEGWTAEWVRWARSDGDGLVHAFSVAEQPGGRWHAACTAISHPVEAGFPGALRCPRCVLSVRASGTAWRHRRANPPGRWARLTARLRASGWAAALGSAAGPAGPCAR